ncbi:MAG TPA: SMI1/KNR4 family protein [Candidatus Dormibacteraeota bacterium]|jgi:cell wall assembly regulator SMI1
MALMPMVDQWIAANSGAATPGASDEALDAAAAELGIELPSDYRTMMSKSNGGEAEFGESWIVMWRVEDLVERNAGYKVQEFAPGFTFFGSNGAGEACAWDWRPTRQARYVVIPFITPEPDAAVPCGDSLEEFLATLNRGIPFERIRE